MLNKTIYIFLFLISVCTLKANAQRDTSLTKQVEVVKAFKPTIGDANKLNDMPKIDESEHQIPTFNYSINSKPILNTFSVNSLKAASITSTQNKGDGYGLIRAGVGNYNKPYGEFFFNHLNSKKSIFGIHAKHLSSLGKIELEGGDKVEAPFSDNQAEIYVNHFFRKSILGVNLDVNHNGFNYYGYPKNQIPDVLKKENQSANYQGTKQAFTKGGINIKLTDPSAEMDDQLFSFDARYHYFKTKTEQIEQYGEFSTYIQKPFNSGTGLLDASLTYVQADEIFNRETSLIGSRKQTWLFASPAYYFGNDVANIKIGFKTWFIMDNDFDADAKITPNLHFNFNPVKNIIKLYAGIGGNYINNHYSKIAYENPFIDPEHDVKNSFEKLRFYGGFDGKFSKKTNFKIGVDYSMIDDQPFYYLNEYTYPDPITNPNPIIVDNDFNVLYDNIDLLKFNFEVFHTSSDKLNLLLSANYYSYNLKEQESAWNMPNWDANLTLDYKITEQLSVSTEIYLIGARKALIIETLPSDLLLNSVIQPAPKSFNLDTAFDMNVRGNYKITQDFSVFAQLNNFGFQKYERWFGYPVQSFNFLAGVSYAF